MAIPDFQTLMLPLVRLAADGQDHTVSAAIDMMAAEFSLSDGERDELLPSGTQRKFVNRVNWSLTHLRKAGVLESSGRARFRITSRGRTLLGTGTSRIGV